jgi:hypothetical protein
MGASRIGEVGVVEVSLIGEPGVVDASRIGEAEAVAAARPSAMAMIDAGTSHRRKRSEVTGAVTPHLR